MAKKPEIPDLRIRNSQIAGRRAASYATVWEQVRDMQQDRMVEEIRTMTDPEHFRDFPPDAQLFMGIRALEAVQETAEELSATERVEFATAGLAILEERYRRVGHAARCAGSARLISPVAYPPSNPRN